MAELMEFLNMGGYAFFVWSSYAITAVLLGGVMIWSIRENKRVSRETIRRAQHNRRNS